MEFALELALVSSSPGEALDKIADFIGSGLMAAEAVPAVFGILAASKGDTAEGIYAGVNIGSDTDTVATMVGGILGALNGPRGMPESWLPLLEKANGFDISGMAKEIAGLRG
jgi:ADP-ribosylglycohydrolase